MKHFIAPLLFAFGLAWTPLVQGQVVISEFMARNNGGLRDEDGVASDWIEIHNQTALPVNLAGWSLTDSTNALARWTFPATNLDANGYMVVFASGKNRANAGTVLHTDFNLSGTGEYLALVRPDSSIATEFRPAFPEQFDNVSYGNGRSVQSFPLVTNSMLARYLAPSDGTLGTNWVAVNFNDTGWAQARSGFGFSPLSSLTQSGLLSYWPVREGSGTTVANAVSGGVNATLVNATWTSDSQHGAVLDFNGTSAYATAGTIPALSQSVSTFTWSFWWKQLAVPNASSVIFGNRSGGTASPVQFCKFTPSNFEYYRGAGIGFMPYTLPSGEWLHVCAVKNGGSLAYYVNGSVVGSTTANGDLDANPLFWGGDPGATTEWSRGQMDEVSIWNRALSPTQVAQLAAGEQLLGLAAQANTDLKTVLAGKSSLYTRYAFQVGDNALWSSLKLKVRYDDGFVAYLNGVEVARRNTPEQPAWNGTASVSRTDLEARTPEEIDLTAFMDSLEPGTNVLAFHTLNVSASDADMLILPELTAALETGLGERYFGTPTPGFVNDPGVLGYVADTKFSHDRGFYEQPFDLAISCATPGSTLYYTTNNTPPSETNGLVYTTPIRIGRTTVVRAIAIRPGWQPSNLDTQSYLFLSDILAQTGQGQPATWGTMTADYTMDPRVVTNAAYRATITNDMKSLPIMCVTVRPDEFFGPQGIYSLTSLRGVTSERLASAELFFPDGSRKGFAINCGVRISGGASRTMPPKHGIRLVFRSNYGAAKLKYKFFDDSEVDSFDAIQFRPNFNMSWVRTDNSGPLLNANADGAERTHAIYVRDQFTKDSQIAMGQPGAHQRFVHLYINGLYWGVYNPGERTDASFAASYLGGEKEEYDAVFSESNSARAVDGDMQAWLAALNISPGGITNDTQYAAIKQIIDVENLADYMMLNFYTATMDWPWQNWNAVKRRTPEGRFKFLIWDAEYTLETMPWVPDNRTTVGTLTTEALSPARFYQLLRSNVEWQVVFGDRAHKHFFNQGMLTTNQTIPRFLGLCNVIDRAIVGESARWGDTVRTANPYTRDIEWVTEKNRLLTSFFAPRSAAVLQQLRNAGLYPLVVAPVFSQTGVVYSNQFSLLMTAPSGTIYYTTNGSDPRLPGGLISPGAQALSGPVTLRTSQLVKARALSAGSWSAVNEAVFLEATPLPLRITEIMYYPSPGPTGLTNAPEDYEYVVLRNVGSTPLSLQGMQFTRGITFALPGLSLAPGSSLVVARNPLAFQARYGTNLTVVGPFAGSLSDNGETIALTGSLGQNIHTVQYQNWQPLTEGWGFSLAAVNPAAADADWSNSSQWRTAQPLAGPLNLTDPVPALPAVVITEVLSSSTLPAVDVVELHNPTALPVDISGWFLSDANDELTKYRFPANTVIPGTGYLTVDETAFAATNTTPFRLGALGDQVYLSSGAAGESILTGYRHQLSFGAAPPGVTWGRMVTSDGREHVALQTQNTLGTNNSLPVVGPVVISEIHYHAAITNDSEFVELRNVSGAAVALFDPVLTSNTWHLAGLGYTLPESITLQPGEYLVVAATDPATFRQYYPSATNARVVGPFAGSLKNSGETLTLQRPGLLTLNNDQWVVPYHVVDQVLFNDRLPWPPAADGAGASLQRLNLGGFGSEPTNWTAAIPTPAQALPLGTPPRLTSAPAPQRGLAGQNLILTATFTGAAPLYYQWRMDGNNLTNATNSTLVLGNVSLAQSGAYQVCAFNPYGADASPESEVVVNQPATITRHPVAAYVRGSTNVANYGATTNNAVFSVEAVSSTPLRYQWRRNGIALPGETNATLTIVTPTVEQDGDIDVVVSDVAGSVASTSAKMAVLLNPQFINLPPLTNYVVAGGNCTLGTTVRGNPAPFLFQWRRASAILSNVVTSERSCFVTLRNVATNQGGLHRLLVTNAAFTTLTYSYTFYLVVQADDDKDGIPNVWEDANGLVGTNALDAAEDTDQDGMSNLAEYQAGTDPRDPESKLAVLTPILGGNPPALQFMAVSNRTYAIEYSDNLTQGWKKLRDVYSRTNTHLELLGDAEWPNTNRLYRVRLPGGP
jgi:hypothetical protein